MRFDRKNVDHALTIIAALGLPRQQQNDRSALTLLALAGVSASAAFHQARAVLIGISPVMAWIKEHYGVQYAPNTRETFRRQTMHQFVAAGLAVYNPDKPERAVNSPAAVYQLSPEAVVLLRTFETDQWSRALADYLASNGSLAARYAAPRDLALVPVTLPSGGELRLSPGDHSDLIKAIVEQFASRFVPDGVLVYAGDTGSKAGHFDHSLLSTLGVVLDRRGKMPDVVLYDPTRNWLILAEAVTSHGPVDPKRHAELAHLFGTCTAGLVYVTAFADRAGMARYVREIAWETEVWVADAPTHLIHFNGERFLGPYSDGE